MDSALRKKGMITIQPEKCQIQSILEVCVDMMKDQAKFSGVDLVFKTQKNVSKEDLMIDVMRVQQIVINLLSNAIKFSS